jgi:hypothetical protein
MESLTTPDWIFVLSAALAASTIAAVTGTGGGIILLPVLAVFMGVRDAVPAYTVAQFIGNLSRVYFNRDKLRLDVASWFILGAMPAAILGSVLFARTDDQYLMRALGIFFLLSVAWSHLHAGKIKGFPVRRFTLIGGVFGFISAYLGSAGPFLAPFYLAFGLTRGTYIGTEALGTAAMHIVKLGSYGFLSAFSESAFTAGLLISPIVVCGSYIGKRILDYVPQRVWSAPFKLVHVL